jgi:hypothetical protein
MLAAGGRVLSQRGVAAAAVASLLLAAAAGGSRASSAQRAKGAPPRIGSIQRIFLDDDECNCTLYLPARRNAVGDVEVPTIFTVADLRDQAQMNIDGQDVMLRRVRRRTRVGGGGPPRVGERSVDEYEGGGARVRVVSTITEVCPPDEPTCETLSNSAVITVTKGGRARTLRASGGCGC